MIMHVFSEHYERFPLFNRAMSSSMDLGNGVKTNAQLTYPAVGKGPFPAVLLVHGTGPTEKNETLTKNAKPFWQIAQYLSERAFWDVTFCAAAYFKGTVATAANKAATNAMATYSILFLLLIAREPVFCSIFRL
ncbi:MAG: hypothetical protein WA323_07440 [Candidatus Nitrosopolaris sp.]